MSASCEQEKVADGGTRIRLTMLFLVGTAIAAVLGLAAYRAFDEERLLSAARDGDLHAVRSLVARGVDIHCRDGWSSTALMYASANGHTEGIEFVIDSLKCV